VRSCRVLECVVFLAVGVLAQDWQECCAYTALQNDTLLAKLRGTPEFSELRLAAKQCQDKFLDALRNRISLRRNLDPDMPTYQHAKADYAKRQ